MPGEDQYTSAQLADGTTLKFKGQLSPDQVKAKVQDYRASKAQSIQSARSQPAPQTSPSDSFIANSPVLSRLASFGEGVGTGLKSIASMPGQVYHAFTDDPTPEEKPLVGGPYSGLGIGLKRLLVDPQVSEYDKAKQAAEAGHTSESMGHSVAAGLPLVGPMAAHLGEVAGQDPAKALGEGATYLAAPKVAGKAAGIVNKALPEAIRPFPVPVETPLVESAHRILGDAATKTKQLIGQGGTVHQAVSNHFGRLANDVYAADYADTATSNKKIDTSSLWDEATKHADDYAAGKTTPNFNAITKAIQNRPVDMTFKELHDLKKEVSSGWDRAKPGTPDAAAASKMLDKVNDLLDQRATDIGRGKQWDAANTIWSTLKEYQGDGALNKLLNPIVDPAAPGAVTEGGQKFFDQLRDPANLPKLKEVNKALEPYGMPANYFTDLAQSHRPLHNLVTNQGTGISIGGKMRAIGRAATENPLISIPAVGAGAALGAGVGSLAMPGFGSTAGGIMGATKALKMVENMAAKSAIKKLGGIPADVDPMAAASKVQPVGTGEKAVPPTPTAQQKPLSPTPAASPTVNEDEIVSALANQGYPRKTARSMAQSAIQDNPHDFDAALRQALGQKTVSGAKADVIGESKKPAPAGSLSSADRFQEQYQKFKQLYGREPDTDEMQRLTDAAIRFDAEKHVPSQPEPPKPAAKTLSTAERLQSIKDEAAKARKKNGK